MAKKVIVLDTNILLAFPHSMTEDFGDNTVIVCSTVLQELNSKKSADGEIGYNAREAGRVLDYYRQKGNLLDGVPTESGGVLRIVPDGVRQEYLPDGFSIDSADNRIISTCIHLSRSMQQISAGYQPEYFVKPSYQQKPSQTARGSYESHLPVIQQAAEPVILVTSDVLMRIAATACGVEVQDFKKVMVDESDYTGHVTVERDWHDIERLLTEKKMPAEEQFLENEFVTVKDGGMSALCVHRGGLLQLIEKQSLFGWVQPKNAMQTCLMWALSQPAEELPLVILDGVAGTGKTLLTLAAGLDGTYTHQKRKYARYFKMIITRPIGNAFEGAQGTGYLPGTLEDKLRYLYQSYYDNLAVLLRGNEDESDDQIQLQINDMFDDGIIEVGGLNFIRGRSLINTYMICDECQNASKTLVRDVITRAGAGTKVILAGDPSQIDVPTLSRRNNGLVTAADCMKGSPLCAYLKMDASASVRSPLATDAIQRMVW